MFWSLEVCRQCGCVSGMWCRVHVEEVRNLPVLTGKTSCSVILEVTLYHGDKPLCSPVSTSLKALECSLQVSKKNLPRAAKILFLVSEALQRRKSVGVKKTPKFLYWGSPWSSTTSEFELS